MYTNQALWQDKPGIPGAIRNGPVNIELADDQLLVRVQAWAINPADAIVQDVHLPFVTYPVILGEDVSGTVELVGSAAASNFEVGDRIMGYACGVATKSPAQGGSQDYVVLQQTMACKIPKSLSFTDAAVFPLCISTAAIGLFSKHYLGMPFPKHDSTNNGKYVLVWGGSSGVGSDAIQLSKAVGFEVITTCSAHNIEYVKSIGAAKAFNYNNPSVIDDIVTELDKGECVGILHAAGEIGPTCQVSHRSRQKLFIASSNPVPPGTAPDGVEAKLMYGEGGAATIYREISPATFADYLPVALANGSYKVAPKPEVVPTKGLEGIQEALNIVGKDVSAKKLVIAAQ